MGDTLERYPATIGCHNVTNVFRRVKMAKVLY